MNWRSPHLVTVAMALLALAGYGLWELFPYMLNKHALRADSPYFLPACVACALTPLMGSILYVCYLNLSHRRRKDDDSVDEDFDPSRRNPGR